MSFALYTISMRIVIDVSQIVYQGTGVGRYTAELTKHLLLLNTPHQFIFYAGSLRSRRLLNRFRHQAPWNQATWKLSPFSPKAADLIFNRLNLPIDPLLGKANLFHASDWTQPRTKLPSVTTVHDLVFKKYPQTLPRSIAETQERRLQRVSKFATHIIADSQNTKNDLVKIYGLPEDKITVVYLAHSAKFKPQSNTEIERVKKKYHLTQPYLLSLGTQEPRKNLQKVVEAFKAHQLQYPETKLSLVLVGKHGWGDNLKLTHPQIHQLGFVSDEDLPALYSGATAFVYPSLYEGFGLPVLEAMACGAPVIVSNTSSLPEIVGQAGLLVDPQDVFALREAIQKAFIRHTILSQQSLDQARQFSWQKTAQQTLAVYEKILTNP